MATSILMTDVGVLMCWRQFQDVGDSFDRFCHQHFLSFNLSVGHQHPKDVTNIEMPSSSPENSHQHNLTTSKKNALSPIFVGVRSASRILLSDKL